MENSSQVARIFLAIAAIGQHPGPTICVPKNSQLSAATDFLDLRKPDLRIET